MLNSSTGSVNTSTNGFEYLSSESRGLDTSWLTRQIVEAVFYSGFESLKCLVGIATNIINCLVLWRQGLASRVNLSLFSLGVADCCYFTVTFSVFPLATIIRFYNNDLYDEYSANTMTYVVGVARAFALTSGCINMAVAVDTCVCVVCPHRAASIMRTRTTMSLIVFSFVLMQVLFIIYPFSYRIVPVPVGQQTHWNVVPSVFHEENKLFVYLFLNITLKTVLPLLNVIVVSVATVVTVKTVRSAITWRQKSSSVSNHLQHRQVALTKMLVMLACVFVVTMTPFAVVQVSSWFIMHLLEEPVVFSQFMTACAVISAFSEFNGCVNFFIYYYRSSQFRQKLFSMVSHSSKKNGKKEL